MLSRIAQLVCYDRRCAATSKHRSNAADFVAAMQQHTFMDKGNEARYGG
jgi:hypothetical protein